MKNERNTSRTMLKKIIYVTITKSDLNTKTICFKKIRRNDLIENSY